MSSKVGCGFAPGFSIINCTFAPSFRNEWRCFVFLLRTLQPLKKRKKKVTQRKNKKKVLSCLLYLGQDWTGQVKFLYYEF